MVNMVVKVVVVAIVIISLVRPDESTASTERSAIVLCKEGSIWVPTRIMRPRYQRFLSKPLRSVPLVESLSREVSGIYVLLLLLSGNMELNTGPSDQLTGSCCK